jgi:hypothetical protein
VSLSGMVQVLNVRFSFYHSIYGPVLEWLIYPRSFYIKKNLFHIKWSRLEDHSKTGPVIGWLKTIQKLHINMSGNRMVLVFECLVFRCSGYTI